jgi:hypothetical protein
MEMMSSHHRMGMLIQSSLVFRMLQWQPFKPPKLVSQCLMPPPLLTMQKPVTHPSASSAGPLLAHLLLADIFRLGVSTRWSDVVVHNNTV